MEKLHESLYRLQDEDGCTAYLIVGKEKAYMIDTGMGRTPLMPQIRAITLLPVELLLTHGHPDHYGAAGEFNTIWVHEDEKALIARSVSLCERFGVRPLENDKLHSFNDRNVFDMGSLTLEALPLPGHTPGSCAFGVPEWKELFVGDAIGSGKIVLLTLPGSLMISQYRNALAVFVERASHYGQSLWHGGHCHQAGVPGALDYNPPRMQIVKDMVHLCDKLLSDPLYGERVPEVNAPDGYALQGIYGTAGMIYCKEFCK